ncbi:MAG: hypothetical protein ACW981_00625 [Candidatus Hodarchaeales archaeon]|jgi:hypothetical protein
MQPRIDIILFVVVFSLGYGFGSLIFYGSLNTSSSSFDPFDYLRTHTSTTNEFSNFPLYIPLIIILFVFIIAWIITNRRKKEE